MFRQASGTIHSDAGFSVSYEDRLHVLYREGDKAMRIDVEFLATNGVVLETVSIQSWDPPHGHEPVLRDRIAGRVKEALEFSGLKVHVDDS
jgi:hypothetical protein